MRDGTTWLDCPRCDGQIEVDFRIFPGEMRTWDYPGSPPVARITGFGNRYDCECELTLEEADRLEADHQDRMFEEVV